MKNTYTKIPLVKSDGSARGYSVMNIKQKNYLNLKAFCHKSQ